MKKILFLIALFTLFVGANSYATKIYADLSKLTTVGGVNATWDGEHNTMSWTGTSNNMISNFDYAAGDYSSYESISITVSGLSNAAGIRLQVRANGQEKLVALNGEGNFTKKLVSDFGFTESDLKSVEWVRVLGSAWQNGESHTIDAEHPASAVISDVYMEKPTTLDFDAFGKGSMSKSDLTATGGLTYNPSTGVLTSDGTAGELSIEFAEPVDLKYLKHYNVTRSGYDNIVDCLQFYDEDDNLINTWNGIKWSNTWQPSIDDNATNAFLNHKPVKKLVWPSAADDAKKGKTLTISSIEWTLKTISCAKAGETQLKTLPYNTMAGVSTTPAWNMNTATSTYYGSVEGGSAVSYADVTEYDEVRIYRDNNDGFRAFFVNSGGTAVNNIDNNNAASSWNAEGKYWSIDLSKVEKYDEKVALQGIKSAASWIENAVKDIVAYKTPAVNAAKYTLTGSGMQLAETVAALADASATCIDATGVTGITTNTAAGRTLLTSANPNCLFLGKVGNGYLSNTKNVVDGDACDNLELSDGNYSFKASADFTATSASYDRTFTVDQPSTVCLPFALSASEVTAAGTFYELKSYSEGTLTFTQVDATDAYKPYLFKAAKANPFSGYSGKAIDATPADLSVTKGDATMTGTMARQSVNGKYGWDSADGAFSKATTDEVTIDPFRAYISITGESLARVATLFVDSSVTGINEVSNSEDVKNFEGKVFENGKIYIFKKGMKFNANGQLIK